MTFSILGLIPLKVADWQTVRIYVTICCTWTVCNMEASTSESRWK